MTEPSARRRATRSLVEIVTIVTGVLLALAADQWWQNREERNLEALYLERLVAEVAFNRDVAERTWASQVRVLAAAERTYARLTGEWIPGPDATEAVVDAYDATATFLPSFVDDVLEELVATGNIRLIRDARLRSELFQYRRRLLPPPQFELASLEYREIVRGMMAPDLKLAIRGCEESCALPISDAEAITLMRELQVEPGLDRALSLVVEQWTRGEPYFERFVQLSDELEASIRTAMR